MPIRAVIFDYGKVLSAPPDAESHTRLVKATGLDDSVFEDHYWAHRHDYDSGVLDRRTYWQTIAQKADFALSEPLLAELQEHDGDMWSNLNDPMVNWALKLGENGVKIGVLSNMGDGTRDHLLQRHAFLQRFDHLTWSCELNTAKPDLEIYRHTLDKLGVESGDALFIDDMQRNIDAATNLGIVGILFTDVEHLVSDLTARGLKGQLPFPDLL